MPSMTVSVVGPSQGSDGYRKNRSPWLKKMSSDMPTAPSSMIAQARQYDERLSGRETSEARASRASSPRAQL